MVRRSKRLKKNQITWKARVRMRKIEWLQKRGRMIFLDRVETRSTLWFEGANEDSDYSTKRDVIEVRTLGKRFRRGRGNEAGDSREVQAMRQEKGPSTTPFVS